MKTRFAPVLYFGLVMAAAAQDNEIVVTATKDPVPDTELTVPVTVVRPEGQTSVLELVASVPGVAVSATSPGMTTVGAAGFGDNAFGRLNLMVDGVSLNRPDMAAPVLNLLPLGAVDRIERVSGPVSALYGDQASGGALNLVTREPVRPELTLSAGLDAGGGHRESVTLGTPVGGGSVLAAFQQLIGRPSRDRSASDERTGWGKLVLRPTAGQSLTVSASAADGSYQLPGGLSKAQFDADPDQAVNQDDEARQTTLVGAARWEAAAGDWRIALPTGGTWRALTYRNTTFANYTRSGLGLAEAEPRLSWTNGDVAGGELTVEAAAGARWQRLGLTSYASDAMTTVGTEAVLDRRIASGWLAVRQNWADTWIVSAQGRLENSWLTLTSAQAAALNQNAQASPASWSLGTSWLPWPGAKLSLSAGRTFRYPFLDEMAYYQDATPSYNSYTPGLAPETGLAGTFGGELRGGSWWWSGSATWLEMDNEIVFDTSTYTNKNGAASRHLTGTTVARWSAGGWTAQGDYAYAWARWTAGPSAGKDLTLVPAHRAGARLSWEAVAGLQLAGGARWVSGYRMGGDEANTQALVGARWTADASADWTLPVPEDWGQWQLTLAGRNLTGDRTPDVVYYSASSGKTAWYPTEGRTYSVGLQGSF